jgi:hypothetical protein
MKHLFVVILLFFCLQGFPQESYEGPENTRVEMADQLRSSGKIYVVVAVLSTVLIGMLVYAVSLDRRISKLEQLSEK